MVKSRRGIQDHTYYFQFHPDEVLEELDRLDSKESLAKYCRLAWHVPESSRAYVHGRHIDAIADHLTAVTMGHINRLLINVPPGFMKSLLTNAFWPSWEWGPMNMPGLRYVSAAYVDDLTIRDNRRTRNIIQSPWYQRCWGDRFKLVGDQNAKTRFDNNKGGFKIATSVGGVGTGERGDRFIIDDPHNIKEGESAAKKAEVLLWLDEVVPTRMSDPEKSAIICIMQRLAGDDASGHLLEKELDYIHLCLPMEFEEETKCKTMINGVTFEDWRTEQNELLWPARFTRLVVERDKKAMGPYAAAGQFQQRPAPRGGGLFKRKWWGWYPGFNPVRPKGSNDKPCIELPRGFDLKLLSVDCAFKKLEDSSRVGILKLGVLDELCFVLKDYTDRMGFNETLDIIKKITEEDDDIDNVLVEDKANGSAVIDTLFTQISGLVAIEPEGGKESRATAIQPKVRAGQVLLEEGSNWAPRFIDEFAIFGASSAKTDRVDALSQGLIFVAEGTGGGRARMLGRLT